MIPSWLDFPRAGASGEGAHSAVLIALAGESLSTGSIVLTHRSPSLRSFAGQIAFPGGHVDPGEDAVQAAVREAEEETGLDPRSVDVLDVWPAHYTIAKHKPVTPVLAWWRDPHPLRVASPEELDDVFCASIPQLVDPRNRCMVSFRGWQGPAFFSEGYVIWGFTAGLVDSLFNHTGWARPWEEDKVLDLRAVVKSSRNQESL